jgi:acyl carrier protein
MQQIRCLVASSLKRPVEDVPVDAALGEELGVDSMALIDLNITLEQQFQVTLPDFLSPVEASVRTVEDLARLVAARLGPHSKEKP